ncbi:MAG TPA: hypothetical protein VMW57_09655 [Methyloceanibacter sp.]|nr:hypothetical protein [Methyloceanibacter sp.]
MGESQDRAVGDARQQASGLTEMVGEQHGLAVTGHQRVDGAEQDGGGWPPAIAAPPPWATSPSPLAMPP